MEDIAIIQGKTFTPNGGSVSTDIPEKFVCAGCGKEFDVVKTSCTVNYGQMKNAETGEYEKFCYPCCAEVEKAQMRQYGRAFLYYNEDDKTMTVWPGNVVASNVKTGREWRSNMGDKRVPVSFMFEGKKWVGTYYKSAGDYARCRESKANKKG